MEKVNNRRFCAIINLRQMLLIITTVLFVMVLLNLKTYYWSYGLVRERYNKFKQCVAKEMEGMDPKTFWDKYGGIANGCEPLLELRTPRLEGFRNNDETKYHLLPVDSSANSIILSLGVGHDVEAEKKLKPLLSEDSLFVGVDPDITNHDLYRQVGMFLPMSVGKDSGSVTLDTLMATGVIGYTSGSTFMITLPTLVKEYIPKGTRIIDNIWVDIETVEYQILEQFYSSAIVFREGYSVCQFNLEAHVATEEQKVIFHNFFKQLLEDERFGFAKVTTFAGHWRIFFVDFLDRACVSKYLQGN